MPLQSNPCNPQTSLSHIVLCIIYILYFHIFYIVFAQLCFFFPTHNCIFVFLCCTKNCEKQEAVSRRHYILGQPNLFGLNFSQFLKKRRKRKWKYYCDENESESKPWHFSLYTGAAQHSDSIFSQFLKKAYEEKTCHVLVSPVLFSIRKWLTQMFQQ